MKYEIAIPTNRERITTPVIPRRTTLFVDSEGSYSYKQVILPNSVKGMGAIRQHILDFYRENDVRFLFMFDDDMKWFLKRKTLKKKEGRKYWTFEKLVDVEEIFNYSIELIKKEKASVLGYDRITLWSKFDEMPEYQINRPVFSFILLDLKMVCSSFDERLKCFEDFDFLISEVSSGNKILRLKKYLIDVHPVNHNGGCQKIYEKNTERYARLLEKKYADHHIVPYQKSCGLWSLKVRWNELARQ